MPALTDVVKHLLIINVVIFFLAYSATGKFIPDLQLIFSSEGFAPYQLITHMFMHADESHLFFNMFGLFIFGPHVERYVGKQKFFILYFLSGLGAVLAHFAILYYQYAPMGITNFGSVLGASGALMGIVLAFAVLFPDLKMMLLFPPIPIKAKYLALGYVALDLYSGLAGTQTGVANFAHLGGALTGFLLTYFWLKKTRLRR